MVGDFNARTGNLPDLYTPDDIVTHDVQSGCINVVVYVNTVNNLERLGIRPTRNNLDQYVNNSGNKLAEMCKLHDLLIVIGRCGTDLHRESL